MAQLKDLIVNGASRFIGPVYTNSGMVAFGTCSTAAATAAKEVVINDPSWTLKVGNIIGVKATTSNSASNVTLNVNGTGAKSIYYDTYVYTGSTTAYTTKANAVTYFIYDGTYWVWIDCNWNLDSNTYTSAYCTTGASNAAKTASLSNYALKDNSYTFISISNANTAQSALTLNINSKGAKPIYINGTASSATNYTLPAGTYIIYYDGTNYQFRTDGKIPNLATIATSGSYNDLSNKPTIPTETTVSDWGFTKNTGTYSKPSGGIPKTDLASDVQTSLGKADTALQSYTEKYTGTYSKPSGGIPKSDLASEVLDSINAKMEKNGTLNVLRYPTSTGYLKFAECTLNKEYGNKYVVLFVTTEYGTTTKAGNGIVYINIRGNGAQPSGVTDFYWLLNGGNNDTVLNTLCWAVNDHKIEFYRRAYDTTEYSQVSFKILNETNFESASKWVFELNEVPFVAGTPLNTPIGEVHDIAIGGIVNYARRAIMDVDGNNIKSTYYKKPSGGIPKTDLASAVQTSLGKADTALQSAPVTSVNGQTGAVTITNITGSAGSATNDGDGNNIASTYKPKSLGSKTFTAQDKDGTAIVGSANDAAGASFYFGKVTPTDFKSQWEITYRIKVYCASNSDYQQSATVRLFGAGAVRAGYETTNDIYNTSYRAAYYHNLYSIKSAGFTNGYGNLIGVGLNNSTNPTNTSYPRTIEVEILDTKNCVFSFFDYALKYANVAGTGSTNFDGLSQWDFANNGHKPNDNNLDRIRLENGRIYAGAGGIMNYSLCCLDKDGKWQSLTTTSGTGNTKTINTNAKFKDEPVILYYAVNNAATNGNLVANTYGLYSTYPNLDLRYSTNTTTTAFTGNSPIYIECTFDSDGFWSPTTNCITQTLRNGYYYIYLGNTYSTVYQLSLFAEHPVYYCKGTNLTKKQMPIASTSSLGGVKVGDGLSIDTNGVLTVTSGGEAESVQWSGVKNTPTTLDGYGITDAPYIIKFTLNQTSVVASKTPSEMSALFTGDGYVLAKLHNSTNGIYETLEKITCNSTTITFSTIYQNTLGGGFTYKKVIGNIANNTWTYEIS